MNQRTKAQVPCLELASSCTSKGYLSIGYQVVPLYGLPEKQVER